MKGINFVVMWNGDGYTLEVVGGGKTDRINTSCGTIPVSSATDAEWEHLIAGRKSWGINVDWLLSNGRNVQDLLKVGNTYTLRFGNRAGGGVQGTALLKTCTTESTVNSLVHGAFSFQGTGPLEAVVQVQG